MAALGLQGNPGSQGPTGATGPAGPTQTLSVVRSLNQIQFGAGGGLQEVDATCPAGYFLTGGGAASSDGGATLIDSAAKSGDPNSTDQTWAVVYYLAPRATTLDSFAFCAKLQ